MDSILTRAYKITFDSDPPEGAVDWQLADALMSNSNVPKLGEDLAKQVIFRAVNHVFYPDRTTTERIVGTAEGFAPELWGDLSDEPHMADIARKEYLGE